jgi:YD repeat-containing protein
MQAMNPARSSRIPKLCLIIAVAMCLLSQSTSAEASTSRRITKRTIAGRDYEYTYDGQGRLTSYSDDDVSATYVYDYAGRRVKTTVGDAVTPYVCDGDDVAAEFVDEDGDEDIDRRRYYWRLPGIDGCIGFVDVDAQGSGVVRTDRSRVALLSATCIRQFLYPCVYLCLMGGGAGASCHSGQMRHRLSCVA